MVRVLPNWIDSWVEYTELLGTPAIFRKWAGISIIASVLERKVWARTKGRVIYPNQYICLVGPPGIGKSTIIDPADRIIRTVSELHVAPSSVTTASLIDSLNGAIRKIIRPQDTPNFVQFHSLQVLASELGVFLPMYDSAFMNTLTKLYDGELYEERRRTGKVNHIKIDAPLLSILAGTTPSYINSFLPETAWDQGFTSRTIFVFSDQQPKIEIFSEEQDFERLANEYKGLVADLKIIASTFGKVSWEPDTMGAISAWDNASLEPVPEHGKLVHYNSRRLGHCIKLCMVASMARADERIIRLEDFQTAQSWLLEAEATMPDIFKSGGISADARAMEDLWYEVLKNYAKEKKPISEHRLVAFLADRVPSHQVVKIIEIMVRSKWLIPDLTSGMTAYRPGDKKKA